MFSFSFTSEYFLICLRKYSLTRRYFFVGLFLFFFVVTEFNLIYKYLGDILIIFVTDFSSAYLVWCEFLSLLLFILWPKWRKQEILNNGNGVMPGYMRSCNKRKETLILDFFFVWINFCFLDYSITRLFVLITELFWCLLKFWVWGKWGNCLVIVLLSFPQG